MKNVLLLLFVCFAFAKANALQNYRQHVVVQGETIYAIAQKYDITEAQLLELNPDLRQGLKTGATLILPANAAVLTQARIKEYKEHKVKRKETLYAIAKAYGVTILDIKEANKELYSRELNKGERLAIPVFETAPAIFDPTASMNNTKSREGMHEVQPKETKYGIAKKYGLTVKQLEALNPEVDNIQPGMWLQVRAKESTDTAAVPPFGNFMEYEVPAKMTMYTLETTTGMTQEAIEALNPALKDGLKAGMVLKLPKTAFGTAGDKTDNSLLGIKLPLGAKPFKEQRIAMMLPFSLDKKDNTSTDLSRLKKDLAMRVATDFYMGASIARDSANNMGIPVSLDVYDTHKNNTRIDSLLKNNDFSRYNVIVGPLLSKNVEYLAQKLQRPEIPIVSPITALENNSFPNIFQARPDERLLKKRLLDYLKKYARGKHIIIIADYDEPQLQQEFKAVFPGAKVLMPTKSNYIFKKDYIEALTTTGENIVLIAAKDPALVDDTVVTYGKKGVELNIRIFAYEDFNDLFLPKEHLAATSFTFPSVNYHQGTRNGFYGKFIAKYGRMPNEYAVRGFDVTLDVILRQQEENGMYDSVKYMTKSMMVENPFQYVPKPSGVGFENTTFFLLQYTKAQTLKRID